MQCSKKTKSINRSTRNNKNKKIMDIKETKNERYVEIYATNNEGTTMTIRKFIGEKGMYEAYLDTYSKLINMGKKVEWDMKIINVKIYNGGGGL